MNVVKVPVEEIKPAEYNPRKQLNPNDPEYQSIKKSIQEFGYIAPIIINADGTIIGGHQRFTVLKDLGYTEVEVIKVDLDKDKEKALNVALNKIKGRWDNKKLDALLKDLGGKKYDLTLTGFKPNTSFEFNVDTNHREQTYKQYNLDIYDETQVEGKYQMPVIEPEDFIPDDLVEWHNMMHNPDKNMGVHCFIDDYMLERMWKRPDLYLDKLSEYQCMFSPDYSLYLDMPMAMKIWNVYRSRLIGQYYQNAGLIVIPSLQWAEPETFEFCFDGLKQGGTVAVSTLGVKRDKHATEIWYEGMDEAINRLHPNAVLVYGGDIGYDFGETKVVYYINNQTQRGRDIVKARKEKQKEQLWEAEDKAQEQEN